MKKKLLLGSLFDNKDNDLCCGEDGGGGDAQILFGAREGLIFEDGYVEFGSPIDGDASFTEDRFLDFGGKNLSFTDVQVLSIKKTILDYLPALLVETDSSIDNYITMAVRGKQDQFYVQTTDRYATIILQDYVSNAVMGLFGADKTLAKAYIRAEGAYTLDFEGVTGTNLMRMTQLGDFTTVGKISTGFAFASGVPTARVHIAAGTTAATTAPIKIDAGVLMTTPENGAIETTTGHIYWTNNSGKRLQLDDSFTVSTITGATLALPDGVYLCNTTGGGFAVTINPATLFAGGVSQQVKIKKISNNANNVTVSGTTGLIDSGASYSLDVFNEFITVISDGTNLYVV